MVYLLSGDIGGTKTLLQLAAATDMDKPIHQKSYQSAEHSGLADIVGLFLAEAGITEIAAACFALAGPVSGRVVKLTNLPWVVDAEALAAQFSIKEVLLINDFEAAGYGVEALQPADLLELQAGQPQDKGVCLITGAGTGLGVAWMSWQQGAYKVHSSEGGHMDFAPADEMQTMLLRYLHERYDHVSYERIVSGPGLVTIFEFMRDTGLASPSAELILAMEKGDAAAALGDFSLRGDEEIARMTVEVFLAVYGAFVGNMALASLPRGGIFVAGGIAAKISALMQGSEFMQAYLSKGRYTELLASIPLKLVLNQHLGLMGANLVAQRMV